jgi:hypothetical protein
MSDGNLENEPQSEEHPTWEVNITDEGKIEGLPEGIKPKDVILFLGPEGKWLAQNPSPGLLEEIKKWRSDWSNPV